jgi:hypothetical protein
VRLRFRAKERRHGRRVAFGYEVDVGTSSAKQEVANGAADKPRLLPIQLCAQLVDTFKGV